MSGLHKAQMQFAAHIRDPVHNQPPTDVPARRMGVYNDLVYNNIESLLAGFFPVIREILAAEIWHRMVRGFVTDHRCQTPYFMELPREFLTFLRENPGSFDGFPYLPELAHYEWSELALMIADQEFEAGESLSLAQIGAAVPSFTPLAWLLSYRYPVHRISPEYQPLEPPEMPTTLVVYRKRDEQVGFLEVNPLTYRLLAAVRENHGLTSREHLSRLHGEFPLVDEQVFLSGGVEILHDMQEKNLIGFRCLPG